MIYTIGTEKNFGKKRYNILYIKYQYIEYILLLYMDFKNALMLFYIIIISGFFSNFLSCDLIRIFSDNIVIKHILAIISVFYLLTTIDTSSTKSFSQIIKDTLLIYSLYIISTKSKAYFVIPMLIILTIDQLSKIYIDTNKNISEQTKNKIENIRSKLSIIIIMLIFVGFIHYFIRAKREFGDNFNIVKFVLGTNKCENV